MKVSSPVLMKKKRSSDRKLIVLPVIIIILTSIKDRKLLPSNFLDFRNKNLSFLGFSTANTA